MIAPAQSFFTVLNMIVKVGAIPVFVDCDLVTRNIELAEVEAAITPKTKAILPTHWPGSLVDMGAMAAFACYESAYYDGDNALRAKLALAYARTSIRLAARRSTRRR